MSKRNLRYLSRSLGMEEFRSILVYLMLLLLVDMLRNQVMDGINVTEKRRR